MTIPVSWRDWDSFRSLERIDEVKWSVTLRQMRLNCQGADVLSVGSVVNLGQVSYPDHIPAPTANLAVTNCLNNQIMCS